ncbi:MAG: SHOCT domain-containing protein [Dehalococcoidia bacterium]
MAHDRLQRLADLRREGILTDAEYEAKRAALVDEVLSDNAQSGGRNGAHVLLGALGGLVLGLAFVGALLVFVPKEKRPDRLLGAWLGTGAGAMVAAVLLALVSAGAGSGDNSASAQQPLYVPPTAVSSLLTKQEACQIAIDFSFTSDERVKWLRCAETRYRSEDRTWVVTMHLLESESAVTPLDTDIKLIDDRCGRPVGSKACE